MDGDLVGKTVGPFMIESCLGVGAMGAVYRGKHKKTGKYAAIKVMRPAEDKKNDTFVERFKREIEILSQFRHPNIVRSYGDGEENGVRFYVMELIEGRSLDDLLTRKKKLSPRRTIGYTVQICEALQEMHAYGVIHRDLKPANVMISNEHRVKLTDFGIAKDLTALSDIQLTRTDQTVGTVAYMSPEQLSGQPLSSRSDLYALGILVYRMLTGKLPFAGDTMFDYINHRMKGKFASPSSIDSSIPPMFDTLLRDMLAKDPDDRPRDAYVVMQRLLEIKAQLKSQTVQAVSAKQRGHTEETAVAPTQLDTVGETVSRPASVGRRPKPKRKKLQGRSLWESTTFLVGCLLALLGFTTYMLWPPGPEQLLARGQALVQSDDVDDWKQAVDDFSRVIAKYPDTPWAAQARELLQPTQDKVARDFAESRINFYNRFGKAASESTPAEERFFRALEARKRQEESVARAEFQAIVDRYTGDPKASGWVQLAREELQKPIVDQATSGSETEHEEVADNGKTEEDASEATPRPTQEPADTKPDREE